jgi:hypothetical protein
MILMSIAVMVCLLLEQFNTAPTSDYSKQQQLDMLAEYSGATSCAAVLLCFRTQVYIGILLKNIDAMIIAQNIIYQPLMAIVGLLRHIGIQLMTLMTYYSIF